MGNKPSVLGKTFIVEDGDDVVFTISEHNTLPDHFRIYSKDIPEGYGFKKTTVWQLIDKKQWIIKN